MKKLSTVMLACVICMSAQAQILIDDFSGDLSAYTDTRILDANGGAANVYTWEIVGGSLQLNTSSYDGIEQYALTRTDYALNVVGFELMVDYSASNLGSQDIGLYVGAGTPTADVREDYVSIYMRDNGQIFSRGFDGTSEFPLSGGGTPAADALFVARTGVDTFELGYYEGGARNVLVTRTVGNTAIGDSIGFYADVRALGIRGNVDNLLLNIPEPSTAALLGLGGLMSFLWMRRRG